MFWIIIVSFAVLMGVAILIYMMPTETAKPVKKKERKGQERAELIPDPLAVDKTKDWKAIAERWEKNIHSLQGELEKMKMDHKKVERDIEDDKAKNKDLVEKLSLEKGWREKEQVNLVKAKHHEKDLKDQIIRTEKDLEREHSERLRLEREVQELKIKYDAGQEEKRISATKAMSLETTVAQLSSEVKSLRQDNAELKKKRDDIQWVAKTEYDDLKKELERFKNRAP